MGNAALLLVIDMHRFMLITEDSNLHILQDLVILYLPNYDDIDEQMIWDQLPKLEKIEWYNPNNNPPRISMGFGVI